MKLWTWQTADRKFRAAMLKRWSDGTGFIACKGCGHAFSENLIDVAHWISRRVKALRWWPTNVLPLCRSCHQRAHRELPLMLKWMEETFEDVTFDQIKIRLHGHTSESKAIKELMSWAR